MKKLDLASCNDDKEKNASFNLRMSKELFAKLDNYSYRKRINKSQIVREALVEYLKGKK